MQKRKPRGQRPYYFVYQITIAGIVRYVGYTKDLIDREKQHNYYCWKTENGKKLYKYIREQHPHLEIKLEKIASFNKKTEAKRWEAYLILNDHFGNKQLWQAVPKISDI